MREIGRIARLQVQRASLKTGKKPDKVYDPAPLVVVERLALSPDGALGRGPDGGWIVDVHHRAHPATKNQDGLHGVSVGFTSHYAAMRQRLGERITLGCAGENIIAEADRVLTEADLRGGVAVIGADGEERLRLQVLQVAHPCRPFTGWALGRRVEPDALQEHLRFLDGGTRGFYCLAEAAGIVEIGDRLVVL